MESIWNAMQSMYDDQLGKISDDEGKTRKKISLDQYDWQHAQDKTAKNKTSVEDELFQGIDDGEVYAKIKQTDSVPSPKKTQRIAVAIDADTDMGSFTEFRHSPIALSRNQEESKYDTATKLMAGQEMELQSLGKSHIKGNQSFAHVMIDSRRLTHEPKAL